MPLYHQGMPEPLSRIHIMGICGTAMGAIAGMLADAGYTVTGSDKGVYPPMSDYLAGLGIRVMEGFNASNLDTEPPPDLVVVGNVIRASYEEAQALIAKDLPYCSFPHLLGELFLKGSRSVVITGTHGKTTTTALTAWMADRAGLDPGYLVGGVVAGWERTARAGRGTHFVIEGDEYDTAFFDKGPKFLHYRAKTAILTSVEFDHADIYRDLEHVQESFRALVQQLPKDGLLIARWDSPEVRQVCEEAECEIWSYGPGQDWDGRVEDVDTEAGTMTFSVSQNGKPLGRFTSCMVGEHNLYNQVAAIAALTREGLSPEQLAEGLASFQGIKRRQEVIGVVGGVTVLDDFAHHPTAVAVTLDALRLRFGGRRLWAVFEPRSASSRRLVFQQAYSAAFDAADRVVIAPLYDPGRIPEEDRLDPPQLAAAVRARGREALYLPDTAAIVAMLSANVLEGDVVAVLSNGGFDGLHRKLLDALRLRFGD